MRQVILCILFTLYQFKIKYKQINGLNMLKFCDCIFDRQETQIIISLIILINLVNKNILMLEL